MFNPQFRHHLPKSNALLEPDCEMPIADFVLHKSSEKGWEVLVATKRAFHWISANHTGRFDRESGKMWMTLNEANVLLREVRRAGLRTRYGGRIESKCSNRRPSDASPRT